MRVRTTSGRLGISERDTQLPSERCLSKSQIMQGLFHKFAKSKSQKKSQLRLRLIERVSHFSRGVGARSGAFSCKISKMMRTLHAVCFFGEGSSPSPQPFPGLRAPSVPVSLRNRLSRRAVPLPAPPVVPRFPAQLCACE